MKDEEIEKIYEESVNKVEQETLQPKQQPNNGSNFAPQNYELSQAEEAEIEQEVELEKQFGDSDLKAGALGAARGLSFGLSDQALTKTGIYTPEELSEIKKRNEIASLTGEIGAIGATALASGGSSLAAKGVATAGKGISAATKAGLAAEKLTEKAFAKVLAEQGKKSFIKDIVRRTAPKAIGSSVEGAAYGLGQLVSEDALGEAELNAENMLAAAGTGALLGGAAGGFFAAPAALVPVAKKVGSKISGSGKSITNKLKGDPVEAALDIYGVTPSKRTLFKEKNAKFVEELPEWTAEKAKLGYFTGSKSLRDNIVKVKDEAGKKIGDTLKNIDEVALSNPGVLPSARQSYSNVAAKVDDIVKEFESVPGFKTQLKPVKDIRNDFIEMSKKTGDVQVKQIHELRRKIDDLIKFDKNPGQYTLKDKALSDVRLALNNEIDSIAEKTIGLDKTKSFGNLLEDLKVANKDYSYASRVLPFIEKKIDKEATKRGVLNLTDILTGGSLLASDMTGAAAITVGAKKLLESDIRRRVSILSSIEKQNRNINNKITNSAKSFLEKAKPGLKDAGKALKTTSTKAFVNSNLSIPLDSKTKKKPENRQEAFKNISNNIIELTSNPEKLQELIARRTAHLQNVAPNITQESIDKVIRGLEFLSRKLPKPAKENLSAQMFNKREYAPSEMQLAKFERYVEAVENPMSVVENLENGTITREGAEALKVVYPMIFQKLQQNVMETIQESKEPISYSKRLELGILFDMPTDASLEPQNIAALQQNIMFADSEAPQSSTAPTAARADSLDMAGREETKQNRISQR